MIDSEFQGLAAFLMAKLDGWVLTAEQQKQLNAIIARSTKAGAQ